MHAASAGVEVHLLTFLFSALDGNQWSASCHGHFTTGKSTRYALSKRLGGSHNRSECFRRRKIYSVLLRLQFIALIRDEVTKYSSLFYCHQITLHNKMPLYSIITLNRASTRFSALQCCWWLPSEWGAVRVDASPQREWLRHHARQSRLQNGWVAADGAMVGPFTERFVRRPNWNKWDKWCKWPGQCQCCWRVSFTAGKGVVLDKHSKTVFRDRLYGYYMRTPTYPAYKNWEF